MQTTNFSKSLLKNILLHMNSRQKFVQYIHMLCLGRFILVESVGMKHFNFSIFRYHRVLYTLFKKYGIQVFVFVFWPFRGTVVCKSIISYRYYSNFITPFKKFLSTLQVTNLVDCSNRNPSLKFCKILIFEFFLSKKLIMLQKIDQFKLQKCQKKLFECNYDIQKGFYRKERQALKIRLLQAMEYFDSIL